MWHRRWRLKLFGETQEWTSQREERRALRARRIILVCNTGKAVAQFAYEVFKLFS